MGESPTTYLCSGIGTVRSDLPLFYAYSKVKSNRCPG